jgi:hypothetical protein
MAEQREYGGEHMVRKILTSGMMLAALSVGVVATARAQGPDLGLAVRFTFCQPVALPRVTLPAGSYMFRLVNPASQRSVVRVADMNGKNYGMFMTMPIERNQPPNDPEVRFLEAGGGTPNAIATYWYPGQRSGWEFIYPRSQAVALAKSSGHSVLTTATEVSDDSLSGAPVVRVNPAGDQAAAASGEFDASAGIARGEVEAPVTAPLSAQAQSSTGMSTPEPSTSVARSRLPDTASLMPLAMPVGGVFLAAGLLLGLWRRTAA